MSNENRRQTRHITEAGIIAVGIIGGFSLADQAGAQDIRPIPGLESLAPASQHAVVECPLNFADVYEVTQPGGPIAYGHTSLHEGQTLMELSRTCLGVNRDTPDPTGAIKHNVAELALRIQNDNEITNPADIRPDTTLAVDITYAASLRATIGPTGTPTIESSKPTIQTGQILAVGVSNPEQPQPPQSLTHTVVRGEWLGLIARNNNTTVDAIVAANPGIDPNLITIGQVLNMPSSTASSSMATENMGPSSGENVHTVINSLTNDPTVSYLMSDTGRYMITSKIIEDALSSGVTNTEVIRQRIVDAYTAQYQGYINSAHKRPTRDEAIQYLVDIAKLDPAAAAALIDQAAAHPESIDGLGAQALNGNVDRYVAARSTRTNGVSKTENMGPGSGPNPEEQVSRILAGMTNPAALMYVKIFPEQATAIARDNIQNPSDIETLLYTQYLTQVGLDVMSSAGDDELLAKLQGLTDVSIAAYRQFLLNNKTDSTILVNYLTTAIPEYVQVQSVANNSQDLLARLKPEVFVENDITGELTHEEIIRIAFMMVRDDLAVMILNKRANAQLPEEVAETYEKLAELMGQSTLETMLRLQYASGTDQQTLDILTTGSGRYNERVLGRVSAEYRSTLTPENALDVFKNWNEDPLVSLYIGSHPDEARAYIYRAITLDNEDMFMIREQLAVDADRVIRGDLHEAYDDEQIAEAIQRNAGFSIAPYRQDLIRTYRTAGVSDVLDMLAFDAASYAAIQRRVELNEEALRRIDIATYEEKVADPTITHAETIRRIYDVIEDRIRSGARDYEDVGHVADPTDAATYRNLARLAGEHNVNTWLDMVKDREIQNVQSSEIIQMIADAYGAYQKSNGLRSASQASGENPSMNRQDNGDELTDNTAGGEGNGVTVQSGDILTTPIVEPDRRGDNAIDTPPSPYVNPSDFNPDGTRIDNPAAGMGQNTVSPIMAGTPSLSAAVAAHQAAEGIMTPRLSADEVLKIIQEDGIAIEAINTWYPGGRGPDPMTMYATGEYIRTHQQQIQRKIAEVEAKYSQLPPQEQTQWMLSISNLEYYLNQFNTASTVEDKVAAAIAVAAISAGLGIALS